MPRLMLRAFGGLEIRVDGKQIDDFGSRKTCALLLYLAVESGQVHQRVHLAGLLWPDRPEQTARTYLRQSIAALRDILGDRESAEPYLVTTRQTVQLNPHNEFWLDSTEILSGLAATSGPHRRAMTPEMAHQFGQAVELYRGSFLEGFHLDGCAEFSEWQLLTGEHIRRLVIETLARLTKWYRQARTMPAALSCARRRVELDPLSEEGQRQYMQLLAESGEGNAALALYDQYRDLLLESLHSEPAPATTKLAESIRSGEISTVAVSGVDMTGDEAPVFLQQAIRRPRHPFVARESELNELASHLSAVTDDSRQGRIVFITGAAGQGKTELMLEFARRASAERDDLLTVVGKSTTRGGAGDPLSPVRQILAQLTGDLRSAWAAGLLDDRQVRRLWTASPGTIKLLLDSTPNLVESLALEIPLRQRIQSFSRAVAKPLLASLPDGSVQSNRDTRQTALFEQLTRLLVSVSERQPFLVLLDDMHWADSDSLSLLLHLGNSLAGSRTLVLGAFRPEEVMQSPHEDAHPFQMVYQELQRCGYAPLDLDNVDGRAFVNALLDSEPNVLGEGFRSTVYGLTEGSPLYTSELVYSMQETGDLVRTRTGDWTEALSLSWEGIPSRVEAVLGRRLAQLSPSQRALLTAASVQGEQFTAEVTAAVLERTVSEVTLELSGYLERRHRLVFAEGLERVGEIRLSRYRFRHALFQQYLYAQLDSVEKGRLHESTAGALEAIYDGHPDGLAPIAGRLAWHWQQAEFPERAIAYHVQAGDWAMRLSAYAQAQDHIERGLDMLEQVPQLVERHKQELELLVRLSDIQSMLYGGASKQVESILTRARRLSLGSWGSDVVRLHFTDRLWAFHHQRGQNQEAYRLAESCLELAEKSERSDFATLAYSNLGTSLTRLGRMEPALDHFVRARETGDALDFAAGKRQTSDTAIIIRVSEANVLWYLGFPDQARQRNTEALTMAKEWGNTYRLVFSLIFTCGLLGRGREWWRLKQCAEQAYTLCVENQFTMWQAISCLYQAWALVSIGDCRKGVVMAEEAMEDIRRTGILHIRYPSIMADIYATCDCVEKAVTAIDQTVAMMDETDEREWEPEIHRLHGEIALTQDNAKIEAAEQHYHNAIDVARLQQSRMLELRAVTSLAALWCRQGKSEEAWRQLSESYGWFTEGFDAPDSVAARQMLDQLSSG